MALPKAIGYGIILLAIFYSLEHQGYRESLNTFFKELLGTKASHSYAREKRVSTINTREVIVQAVVDASDLDLIRLLLSSNPVFSVLDGSVIISSAEATSVCSSNMTEYECRCEDSLAWSYNNCITYGACDEIVGDTCNCINALPEDGQHCQPVTTPSPPSPNVTTPSPPSPNVTTPAPPSPNVVIDLVVDVRIPVSVLEGYGVSFIRTYLNSFPGPYIINNFTQIIDLNLTTVCYPGLNGGLQCQCEEQFAWSCETCIDHTVCSNTTFTNDSCGCINALPPGGELCEPITSVAPCSRSTNVTTPAPPSPNVVIDLVVDVRIPVSLLEGYGVSFIRNYLNSFLGPFIINDFTQIIDLNLTTVCYPGLNGGLQCQCEEQFAWSCDTCIDHTVCSNTTFTNDSCGCINALPPRGELCEPITSVAPCSRSTNVTTPSPPSPNVTTPAPLSPNVVIDLVVDVRIPVSVLEGYGVSFIRNYLNSFLGPFIINDFTQIIDLNLTTVCYPGLNGGLQCYCEEQFAWSCDTCIDHTVCSNTTFTNDSCGCINALPPGGELCEPITSIAPCPPPTNVTTPAPPTPNVTTPAPPAPNVVTDLVVDVRIPVSVLEGDDVFFILTYLNSFPGSFIINNFTQIIDSNLTTVCYPGLNGGLQCYCEEQFAWSCDTCIKHTVCSNTTFTNDSCGCVNALPPGGELCEPITSIGSCPISTPPTPTTTTTPMTTTTTPMTTTTTPPPTPSIETTPPPPPTPTPVVETFRLIMNIEYSNEYNNPDNEVHQNVNNIIQAKCKETIETFISATITSFKKGSTIVEYTVRASSFGKGELQALKSGIFTELAKTYSMIYQSSTFIPFQSPFLGEKVILTCGTIPLVVGFTDSWTIEWKVNDKMILADSLHKIAKNRNSSTLTIERFFTTDQGEYTCLLKEGNVFRQTSNGVLSVKVTPLVQVAPMKQKVKCEDGNSVVLTCTVNSPYKVKLLPVVLEPANSISHTYVADSTKCSPTPVVFTCQEETSPNLFKKKVSLELVRGSFLCDDPRFGVGNLDDTVEFSCEPDEVGQRIAACLANGSWATVEINCILKPIKELLDQSQFLTNNSLPEFLQELSNVTIALSAKVVVSPTNINAIVEILTNVANTVTSSNIEINRDLMTDVLKTAGVLTLDEATNSWETLNNKSASNSSVITSNFTDESPSSSFLLSIENITSSLDKSSFNIETTSIILTKTTFTDSFTADFNSSVGIDIPESDGVNKSITVITFFSMENVLPARAVDNSTSNVVNGKVVLVQSTGNITNITIEFNIINDSLKTPQCVFWNFDLFDGLGGWDDEGCEVSLVNETVTCNCNHLTSFSILMSPFGLDLPILDYITYIGVGISMLSLVICLIIEAIIWRKVCRNTTAFLRHVSIVNIAVSLLIADIWFIIGAAISDAEVKNPPACTAATFFIHFFYLALFFWMLASALLLLYRTISVFGGDLSKNALLAIGFCLGYGAPLIIAVITIAVTAPVEEYIRENEACWLNWHKSKALLAFVIPALLIVVINLCILIIVLYKMLRRRGVVDSAQPAEKNALSVIARTLAFLTPFFGLTWGLGVGTMIDPFNIGIHIAFAFFNSLQGFFILVFGTLLDKKVWSEIGKMTSSIGTRSTSGGNSSSGLGFFRNWRRRDGYNISSHDSGVSNSYINT
ncbi:adhesion G protein-coupled receptor F5-like isoform X2 [Solea solea]|uniref:adhesion G protein-coupled receptor F5-like isoform X2 n=1 Tax=Solea solea TaxID=90069 RepID=UPI00272DAC50|nr:adhesion G protein-coupled receptor F5-like isoform X2 [Solea solea]